VLAAEHCGEMVWSGVDLAIGSVDRIEAPWRWDGEAVGVTSEARASDDAGVQLARRPVADEPATMKRRLQETDHASTCSLRPGTRRCPMPQLRRE
jgi:hypothetical protein